MPTNHDVLEALLEGRWRPTIEAAPQSDGKWKASFKSAQGNLYEAVAVDQAQALVDLKSQIRSGALNGSIRP